MSESLGAYSQRIKNILGDSKKLLIHRHHIEYERAYRKISEGDVKKVLLNGSVTAVKDAETLAWRGKDLDGQKLELLISLLDSEHNETMTSASAEYVKVKTAYQPGENDDQLRHKWLKENSDWRERPDGSGKVERKGPEVIVKRKPPGGSK